MSKTYFISNFDETGRLVLETVTATKALIIGTAALGENRPIEQDDVVELMNTFDIEADVVDILSYTPLEMDTKMEDVDLIYLAGGNTFYLLDALRKTGFDKWLVPGNGITVIGESAGALVLGSDIAHIAALDDASAAPNLSSTKALNYVPDLLMPHYKGEKYGFGEAIDAFLEQDATPDRYTLIHEKGVMIWDGTTTTWLGTKV